VTVLSFFNSLEDFVSEIDGVLQNLGNTNLSFSPNVILGNIFTYQPKEAFQISFLSKFVGKQWMSNVSSRISENDVLDSFFTSDLNVVYQLKPSKIFKSVTFTALVNNIFNAEYVDRGYYYTFEDTWSNPNSVTTLDGAGYYPQATRNFLLGVTLNF
jgi:iron complex outermembrane receptor protein